MFWSSLDEMSEMGCLNAGDLMKAPPKVSQEIRRRFRDARYSEIVKIPNHPIDTSRSKLFEERLGKFALPDGTKANGESPAGLAGARSWNRCKHGLALIREAPPEAPAVFRVAVSINHALVEEGFQQLAGSLFCPTDDLRCMFAVQGRRLEGTQKLDGTRRT
jgi:hypothetical protein